MNITKEYLEFLYFTKGLTPSEIKKVIGKSDFHYYLKKFNIPKKLLFYISKEELEKLYYEQKLTYKQIEEKFGLRKGHIYNWFKRYNIKARTKSENSKGVPKSEKHKKNIGLGNKDKKRTLEFKKNISDRRKNVPLTQKHKDSLSKTFTGLRTGDKHPMWKGGISKIKNRIRQSFKYKDWRKKVYERDEYTCKKCNNKNSGGLECHHIITQQEITKIKNLKTFDDFMNCSLLWDIDNGITLCKKCHREINGNEKEFEEFFKAIVKKINNK